VQTFQFSCLIDEGSLGSTSSQAGTTTSAGGAGDILEEIIPTTFEFVVVEGNMLGSALIKVVVSYRFCLNFAEAVEVQLTCEGAEFVMIEVLRDDVGGEQLLE
jgi:hypothetical protein